MKNIMRKRYWSLFLVLLLLSGVSFAKTMATVGGTNIDSSEVDMQVKLIVKNSKGKIKDSKALRNDVLQRLISREIIVREAQKLKLDRSKAYLDAVQMVEKEANKKGIINDPSFKKDFESYKKVLLADIYALNFLKRKKITDKEAKSNYDAMVKFYKGSQEVKIGEILTKDLATAEKAIVELNRGTSFSNVARKYTIDVKMKNNAGIYKEYVNLKDLQAAIPEYYAVIRNLNKGEFIHKPLKSGQNYLVIGVVDKRDAKIPSFDRIKNSIKTSMAQSQLAEESRKLSKVYNVKIY